MLLHHVCDTVCDDPGLARTCAREDKKRSVQMRNGISLFLIKALEHNIGILILISVRTLAVNALQISEKLF